LSESARMFSVREQGCGRIGLDSSIVRLLAGLLTQGSRYLSSESPRARP
jgi:hypothetical protein